MSPCCTPLVSVVSLVVELLLLEGRAIDIQSKANLVSGQSFRVIFAPKVPGPSHPLILKLSVITVELLVPTLSGQFPRLCVSMALLHGSYRDGVSLQTVNLPPSASVSKAVS